MVYIWFYARVLNRYIQNHCKSSLQQIVLDGVETRKGPSFLFRCKASFSNIRLFQIYFLKRKGTKCTENFQYYNFFKTSFLSNFNFASLYNFYLLFFFQKKSHSKITFILVHLSISLIKNIIRFCFVGTIN